MPLWIPGTGTYTTTTAAPFTVTYDTTAATAPVYYTMTYDANPTGETCMEEEYEFQVGDVVRIKDRNRIPDDVYFGWDEDMTRWCGQVLVIAKIDKPYGEPRLYFEDAPEGMRRYSWGTDMVELVSPIEAQKELSNEEINDWNTLMNQI